MNKIISNNIIAFHPGFYINEYLEGNQIKQNDFAKNLNISSDSLNRIINGEIEITEEIAEKVAAIIGTSPDLWLKLNQNYLERIKEIKQAKE